MIDRRTFLAGTSAVLLAAPLVAEGQQPGPVHRLGILSTAEPPNRATTPSFVNTVPAILKELGYIEGQTLLIERRFAGGNPERLRQLARELVELRMDVILASGGAAVQAARNATITIPIVMGLGDDPVGRGWAASLARPGGNVTGMVSLRGSLTPKRLQLIKEAMPRRGQMALLLDTAGDWDDVQAVQQVATSIGVKLIVIEAQGKWDRAFGSALTEHAQALLVGAGPNLYRQRSRIIELASKHRLPAIYEWGDAVKEGGLMAYGPDFAALYPRIASYIDRIFKGTSPTEMPIEEPTKFEFVINLKTAKALGLTIPPSLLQRVDRVIE